MHLALLPALALLFSPVQSGPQGAARTGRPAAPYSFAPTQSEARGPAPSLLASDAAAPVEVPEAWGASGDDAVPLPVPALVRAGPAGDVLEAPASGDPDFLGFAAGNHRPPVGERIDPALLASALAVYADGRPSPETYAFVMFSKRMTPERLARLEAAGARALGFHPHYTQKVALPVQAIDAVAALDFVRWIGLPRPWQKLHPRLSAALAAADPNQALSLWISVYESDLGSQSIAQRVEGVQASQPDGAVTEGPGQELAGVWAYSGWQQDALEAAGIEVLEFAETVRAFRVRALPAAVELAAALDFVQFVELQEAARTSHDESMAMVNADDARSFFGGGTNSVARGGIVDSGVELSHQDMSFWSQAIDLSGSSTGAFEDDCGHGTHVAGSMFGKGNADPSLRGAAPDLGWGNGGQLSIAKIFASCAPQVVDVATLVGWMSAQSPLAHVINNSWNTAGNPAAPWIGSETDCRIYDDNAFFDAQLNVFAASNQGPSASSIGLQASAKNVLTVGSVLDYDQVLEGNAGELASSSSRGPTGDNRWKPNLVAPGKWVESCDATNPAGYVLMSGTSMAAPHVSGLAADLIDANSSFAFLPEKLSAHLMATATRKNNAIVTLPSDAHLDTYGAGRVDGTSAIWGGGAGSSTVDWAFSLSSGSSTSGDFVVPSGASRMVVVMHYVEGSSSAGASQALVNDWDLWIDQPPLAAGNNTGEWSAQQSAVDNTELRVLTSPIPGTWRWKAWPDSTSSLAFFGVTVYIEFADVTPALAPTLTSSHVYAAPGEQVQLDYTLATPGTPLSAVHLDVDAVGAGLWSASTLLMDGTWTDLLDNQFSGFELMLGNVHPFFSRRARWTASWASEGVKTFAVHSTSDNASNSPHTRSVSVTVDGTGPGLATNLASTSHQPGVWSNDPSIDLAWTPAPDNVSGLAGYSRSLTSAPSGPPAAQNLGPVTAETVVTFVGGGHWYNLRAVDQAGNWSTSFATAGPYLIDVVAPGSVGNPKSTTHTLGQLSCSTTIGFAWQAAIDFDSGIAGYGVKLDNSPATAAPTTVSTTSQTLTTTVSAVPASWYLHVRAIDNAGNAGATVHLGPFPIDPSPVQSFCTAKLNSQGCTPQTGWVGSPSLSGPGLSVVATNVLNNKTGLLFWGSAASSNPFQGGTKCVANPVKRTSLQDSQGNPPPDDCSGSYAFQFSPAYMSANGIQPGDTVYAQFWSRDPQDPFTTGLTDAIQFTACQ